MEQTTKKNITSIIAAFVGVLLTVGGVLIGTGKIISKVEDVQKTEERLLHEIDELKKENFALRQDIKDLEERTDDGEEFRAYLEGKTGVERTK